MDFEPLVLRPFEAADTDDVVALVAGCYRDYDVEIELETLDADLLEIRSRYAPPQNTFQVLLDRETVIGSVAVKLEDDGLSQLKRLFLRSDYRGGGVGKRLTLWAFQWARDYGADRMHFWSDTLFVEAHALYRHLGCEDTGTVRDLGGINETREYYFRVKL